MHRFVFRLLARSSTASFRNIAGPDHHTFLKIGAWSGHQKCYQCSSTEDLSKLIDCSLTDDFDYEEESPYSKIDVEAIAQGDPEKLKNLKLLQLEIDLMNQNGQRVPSELKTRQWKEVLSLPTRSQRIKYLSHLWLIEKKKSHHREKLQKNAELFLKFKQRPREEKIVTTDSPIVYNLTENSLFYRIRDTAIHRLYNQKLLMAEWFGPQIIVDCSYESFMTQRDSANCAKQMLLMWSDNRDSFNPYDILFCNVAPNGALWQKFVANFHLSNEPDCPIHFTNQHYLSLYSKEKLVYLTPHCNEVLEKYNHDDIYILGAFVDASRSEPVSLAKAKKEGIRKAKLPLDTYLHWTMGTKSLTLNQVTAILNDLKDGLSWPDSLKHVPRRKVESATQLNDFESTENVNHLTAKAIRENYRKNLVYDLLMKEKLKPPSKEN